MPLTGRNLAGPTRGMPARRVALESPVFDLCNDADAYEAYTGDEYSDGALFPGNAYPRLVSERGEMGCDDPSFGANRPRWALRANDWGDLLRFRTRDAAVEYQRNGLAYLRQRFANTIDSAASGLSPNGAVTEVLIWFADKNTPVDEVRVLRDSVTVEDGVLRGFVRNWSRELWAYDVAVTAEGRSFEWPLSVQPGELAPFEIGDWAGATDPARIDIAIAAELALVADLSRAFFFVQEWCRWDNVDALPRSYPPRVLGQLRLEGIGDLCATLIRFHSPPSHQFFPEDGPSIVNLVEIDNLSAYFARFTVPRDDPEDYDHDNPPSPVLLDLRPLPLLAELHDGGYGEIDRWPIWRIDENWSSPYNPSLEAVYATGSDNFTIWIGAARVADAAD